MKFREITIRTSYPNTISGDDGLIDRLGTADVVKIVDMDTKVVLARENPGVLISRIKEIHMNNPKIRILVVPFTPGSNYSPPAPKPVVKLRKAKR